MQCRIHLTSLPSLALSTLIIHPRSQEINYEHQSKLFSSFKEHDYIIIAGDFNSHNTTWRCFSSNSAGKSLESAILDHDLCILNNGSSTRVAFPNQNNSAIDLTIVNPDLLPFCDRSVCEDFLGSDHLPAATNISTLVKTSSRFCHRLDYKSTGRVSKNCLTVRKNLSPQNLIISPTTLINVLNTYHLFFQMLLILHSFTLLTVSPSSYLKSASSCSLVE